MKISDNTAISMPMRNLLSILVAVAAGVWAYSEITTRLTFLETSKQLMEQDLLEASTQKPIDQEQLGKAQKDIEKLKDNMRTFSNGNGH